MNKVPQMILSPQWVSLWWKYSFNFPYGSNCKSTGSCSRGCIHHIWPLMGYQSRFCTSQENIHVKTVSLWIHLTNGHKIKSLVFHALNEKEKEINRSYVVRLDFQLIAHLLMFLKQVQIWDIKQSLAACRDVVQDSSSAFRTETLCSEQLGLIADLFWASSSVDYNAQEKKNNRFGCMRPRLLVTAVFTGHWLIWTEAVLLIDVAVR